MTTENVQNSSIEAVTGQHTGSLVGPAVTTVEIIGGEKVGLSAPAVTPSITADIVTGRKTGSLVGALSVTMEVVGGKQVGRDIFPEAYNVVVEYVVKDASYKFQSTVAEYVTAMTSPPTSIQQQARTLRQVAAQHRATAPLPVKSMEIIGQVRQLVAQRVVRPFQIGAGPVYTMREVVAQRRPAAAPHSVTTVRTVRQVVAKSRSYAALPTSPRAHTTLRQIVAPRRDTAVPATVRSPVRYYTDVQIAALSRRTRLILTTAESFTLTEIVAQRRDAPPPHSITRAWTNRQIALQARDAVMPISAESVRQLQQIALQARVTTMPWSTSRTWTVAQLAAQELTVAPPADYRSADIVGSYVQVAAQHRAVPAQQWSDLIVYTDVMLVAQRRVPAVRPSDLYAGAVCQVAAVHREVEIIGAQGEERAKTLRQIVLQQRVPVHFIGTVEVSTLQVQYLLRRNVPAPADNFDPFTGLHIYGEVAVVAQRRDVDPPYIIGQASRFVFGVTSPVVAADTFPDPTVSITDLTVHQVARPTVLGDEFPDPLQPRSTARTYLVTSPAALGDTFPDPLQPLSSAVASSILQDVVLGDEMPDPTQPLSSAQVGQVAELLVVGDTFPAPASAASTVTAHQVAELLVVQDEMPDPAALVSNVDMWAVTEQVVLYDNTLARLPARTNRRRPVVTVSIS